MLYNHGRNNKLKDQKGSANYLLYIIHKKMFNRINFSRKYQFAIIQLSNSWQLAAIIKQLMMENETRN